MKSFPLAYLARLSSALCFPKRRKQSSKPFLQNVILPQQFMKETSVTGISIASFKANSDSKRAWLKAANQCLNSSCCMTSNLLCIACKLLSIFFLHIRCEAVRVMWWLISKLQLNKHLAICWTGCRAREFQPSNLTSLILRIATCLQIQIKDGSLVAWRWLKWGDCFFNLQQHLISIQLPSEVE